MCIEDCLLSEAGMWQGVKAAERPWRTIGVAAVVMAVLALGLLRFRVETDPQRLWVGPTSQAAQEKAAYEVEPSLSSIHMAPDGSLRPGAAQS